MRKEGQIRLRPTRSARAAFLAAALVFVIVLDFLVVISFLGQKLWRDERLFHDLWFSAPALVWLGMLVIALFYLIRATTQSVLVDSRGIRVRGLLRWPRRIDWEDVSAVWAFTDIVRRAPAEAVDGAPDAHDAVIVMATGIRRIANISGRLYGGANQEQMLDAAAAAQVRVERVEQITSAELHRMLPGSLKIVDRFPNVLLGMAALFYVAHNVLTFVIWGL
ncbi:hypothetical protein M3A96_11140 [Helcobacillus massiliensis]|uniref:PH domain-containing protein n=1 Tax=Helcobacillus massiliensis TaxID=521392 RepID=A0A839R2H3_9MICO|nr:MULTISPECIES: hypothetical protein [Helcobacillus]MBB3023076.1 hypothetical protein [Helcobacillus massiliensis]MCG7426089.1 hypothetical protein [Helcobacillus sp. ACRRO]MCT1558663.1 hypothetical protein [Helcobacillus massiliensis]MCT2037237.1 hypothetical protein [Helcobacillus massiliensis]MCT2332885.1 hypothetical protein [Helcobacillus massiliensis]